jgi:TPR repeat protein
MLRVILLAFALTLSAVPVAADTFDDANAAYARGDYETAERLLRPLAEQGDALAQYNLGLMYNAGEGVPQDYVLAHMWLNLAVARGYTTAKTNRDIAANLMTSEQIAEAQRLAREWKPKE